MKKIIKSPEDCDDAELKSFEELVTDGGEVALAGLRQRIQHAEKLVFINDGKCVAIGAIKNPNAGYKARVFEKSGAREQGRYEYEIGWLYVSESARGKGYGRALMESIIHTLSGKACFATTREDNDSMHHLFNRFGFSKIGQPYSSDNGDYSLVLYAKP
ncbi:N-acetyltransferase [Idiomarina sp. OT37-5b]|uniref:GNAT family N-acetyltransferase n=1 Tax=Idiomarina sp. OT37-5b TaxID=2100422 RepID=UPI000CF8FE72|nr:GNAT family N-acetyltransferase [Idiomarina sp. OT37-5b]AVJ57298.1 N-acetyltransferase [Idiomarina sp. OT37-5b]